MNWKVISLAKHKNTNFHLSWVTLLISCVLTCLYICISPPVVEKYNYTYSYTILGSNNLHFNFPLQSHNDSLTPLLFRFNKNKNVVNFDNRWDNGKEFFHSLSLIIKLPNYPNPFALNIDSDSNNEFAYISAEHDTLSLFIRDFATKNIQKKVVIRSDFGDDQMLGTDYKFLGTVADESGIVNKLFFTISYRNEKYSRIYCYHLLNDTIQKGLLFSNPDVNEVSKLVPHNHSAYIVLQDDSKLNKQSDIVILDDEMNIILRQKYGHNTKLIQLKLSNNILLTDKLHTDFYQLQLAQSISLGELTTKPIPTPENFRHNALQQAIDGKVYYFSPKEDGPRYLFCYSLYNNHLTKVRVEKGIKLGKIFYIGDINRNGRIEIVTTNIEKGKEALLILEASTGNIAASIPISRENLYIYNVISNNFKFGQLCVQMNHGNMFIQLNENKAYSYRWIWWVLILVIFTTIVFVIQWITITRQQKLRRYKNKINELHLQNLRNRFNPHFVFNAINSSSSFLLNGDRMEAYNYLSKLSQLLRFSLNNAEQLTCNLKDELSNCRRYIDIQQMRFPNKLVFDVKVAEGVDQGLINIPAGLLINLSENAIKHGFKGIECGNKILIEIYEHKSGVLIAVEDNGIGREKAAENVSDLTSTNTGEHLINKYISIINHTSKNKMSFNIFDKKNEDGMPSGTRCEFISFY